MADYSVTFGTK